MCPCPFCKLSRDGDAAVFFVASPSCDVLVAAMVTHALMWSYAAAITAVLVLYYLFSSCDRKAC